MLCFLFAALIVALDQFFKHWILRTLTLGEAGPEIIPGVLGLTFWENDGAMLNILSGRQWLLAGIALFVAVAVVMTLLRYNEGFWGTIGLSAILGGTVGNLFDRVFNDGKVVDMFRTLFINFPIFNIADIFITLGFITFLIHFIALTFKEEGEKKATAGGSSGAADLSPVDESDDEVLSDIESIVTAYTGQDSASDEDSDDIADVVDAISLAISDAPDDVQYVEDETSPPPEEYDSTTDTTPDVSFTMETLEAELGINLDDGYDLDDILREYGIEDNDINV